MNLKTYEIEGLEEDEIELRLLSYIEEKFGTAVASEKSLSKEQDKEDEEWKNL